MCGILCFNIKNNKNDKISMFGIVIANRPR